MGGQLPLPWERAGEASDVRPSVVRAPVRAATPLPAVAASAPLFVKNGRARKYILRVLPDARVRVTIPRYGSRREAEAFVRTRLAWIAERQRELRHARPDRRWLAGADVWWRGRLEQVVVDEAGEAERVSVRCGELTVRLEPAPDYRPALERLMRRVASVELPPQLLALAAAHGLQVSAVSVRNQRSRWGSCSRSGRIALNWRLLQMPDAVREYVLLHELMHLREPNHSPRFWALVDAVCPAHREAQAWLKRDGLALC
jgi:predicted metal-dependent hydrolase